MDKSKLDQVFHAYDIRGLVTTHLDEEFFYNLGKAFVTFLGAKRIAVGHDIRPESSLFAEKLIQGATEVGCDVVFIKEIATEMLYFAVGSDKSLDGGLTITASHNPTGWNGCKMVAKDVKALSKSWGLSEIKALMVTEEYLPAGKAKGKVIEKDIYPEFKSKVVSFIGNETIKKMRVVVDAGNGVGGKVFKYIFGDLALDVHEMYFEPDGNFPNHTPDPMKEENVREIRQKVVELGAELGIAIDGDADRVFFIDSKGRNPSGVFTSSIFAKYFCSLEKGAKIVHDPRVVWPVTKEVQKLGGVPLVNKAGHSFFKERLKAENAIFGGEMSSHFFYRDFFFADSGMITIAIMLKLISEGLELEKELDYLYETYIVSGEVNYKVSAPQRLLEKVRGHYSDGLIEEVDGVSVEYRDWRFNLRMSNTEPLVRLNIEASSQKVIKQKFTELEAVINGERINAPSLNILTS